MSAPPQGSAWSLDALAELRDVGEELRAAFCRERRAIAALDTSTLDALAIEKVAMFARLRERLAHRQGLAGDAPPEVNHLLMAIRVEAQATAMLATSAAAAVRGMLGGEPAGYDRRARQTRANSAALMCAAI